MTIVAPAKTIVIYPLGFGLEINSKEENSTLHCNCRLYRPEGIVCTNYNGPDPEALK